MLNVLYAILVLGIMGAIFGALLAFAAKIFYVEQDPRIDEVRAALAGANCGGCGYAGCDAYAAAVVAGEAPPDKCGPGGKKTAEAVAAVMGLDAVAPVKYVAYVPCSGSCGTAKDFFEYEDPADCIAAIHQGGGRAVLAHPYQLALPDDRLAETVRRLKDQGLDGLECCYPRHTPEQTAFYLRLAETCGLGVTAGSDFHGERVKPDIALRPVRLDVAWLTGAGAGA